MKGQMFILTMIFLIGLIYTVQQSLSSYSILDFSEPFLEDDYYIFSNVKDMFEKTVVTTTDCLGAEENLNELVNFIGTKIIFGGFIFDIGYRLSCPDWNNVDPFPAPLNLTMRAIGSNSESYANFELYHQVPPTIYYAKYNNTDDETNPCPLVSNDSGHPLNDGDNLEIQARIIDLNGDSVTASADIFLDLPGKKRTYESTISLNDDGLGFDMQAGDDVFTGVWVVDSSACPSNVCSGIVEANACDDLSCSIQEAYCIE